MPSSSSRRDFLRRTGRAGAGLGLPALVAACGGGGSARETFVEPPRQVSRDGLLDVALRFAYADNFIDGRRVRLRSINGGLTAPTLQVRAGDLLRIHVTNDLPANPPSSEPARHLRFPNSANLHTHGLHVNPGIVRPGVYGDYVIDDPSEGIQPGATRLHEMAIAADHPAGTYWYHTHLHGSTAVQVASGMAGGLIVTGAIDEAPGIDAARERLFVFQAPIFDATGRLESFTQVASPTAEPPFRINGVRRPRLLMRPGEVQKWRFVNAGIANFLNLSLDEHAMHLYAFDGNPRTALKAIEPRQAEGLVLAPGNRGDVLVKAGAPGLYHLRTLRYDMGNAEPLPEDILAEVEVVGDPLEMPLPARLPPVPDALTPISDAELAAHGGLKRNIVLRAVFNDDGAPITAPPASALLPVPPGELGDWTYQTGGTFLADTAFTVGTDGGRASAAPGMPAEFIPVQSERAIRQTVALGSVEEWTLFNMNDVQHPFHIHVNPFQVVARNGKALDEPYWADTIGLPRGGTPTDPTSVTIRTRFTDFAGAYVMHCHILSHEDMGMMQIVEVA